MPGGNGLIAFSDLVPASFDLVIFETEGGVLAGATKVQTQQATLAEVVIWLFNNVVGEELGMLPEDVELLFEVTGQDDSTITLQCLVDLSGNSWGCPGQKSISDC